MSTDRDPTTIIEAADERSLSEQIEKLDRPVPPRSQGRTTVDSERYVILRVLLTLPDKTFPLIVVHRDRPDFHISMPGRSIGIEHVEAISQNEAAAQVLRERGAGPSVHFIRHSKPGESKLTSAELRAEILADYPVSGDENESDEVSDGMGDGWVGDSVEREWGGVMAHFTKSKIAAFIKDGFDRFPENWLAIYDNWALPKVNFDFSKAVGYMRAALPSETFDVFHRILIVSDHGVVEMGGGRVWNLHALRSE